jgi:hypothetical protein
VRSKTMFESAQRTPSGVFGIGVPMLLFAVVGTVLVTSYVTPNDRPLPAAERTTRVLN